MQKYSQNKRQEPGGKSKNHGDRKKFVHKPHFASRSTRASRGKLELEGTMYLAGKKGGFVEVGNENNTSKEAREIHVYPDSLGTALKMDRVLIKVEKRGKEEMGEVVRVIERTKNRFVGTYRDKQFVPDDRRFYLPINLIQQTLEKVTEGDKTLIEITDWHCEPIVAKVVGILGKQGDHETEIRSILASSGIVYDFPPEVEAEAEKQKNDYLSILPEEIKLRRDMRSVTTFTIDPADAKDFDDAISIRKIDDDYYEVGIHIADASFFVQPESALDTEASARANSVYLVDRTIPMLPESLSADICSLLPNQDRLTYSTIVEINKAGKVRSEWFGRTIIHSIKRFTYEEAATVLRQGSGPHYAELTIANEISLALHKERVAKGSVIFDRDEVRVELDKNNRPIRIYVKERLPTHKLIEELMLLANKHVAHFLHKAVGKHGGGSMYRIHDQPDKDRIANLELFLKSLGYKIEGNWKQFGHQEINKLFLSAQGADIENLVQTAVLRSMSKAVYSMRNIGHFGLGFDFYTHFTSPIRRYPDILIHRLLTKYLAGKSLDKVELINFERSARYSSDKEKEAAGAERESIKYKQAEYMQAHLGKGEVFEGTITGVTEWGLFVEENTTKCEGLVRLSSIGDDYYEFDEKKFALIGKRTKRTFRLGDKAHIKLSEVDVPRHQITWDLV